ncbi:MAG: hypothetical protein CL623_02140 [Arcobacter sp.]|nr:hypothetical protein [Arcobacter sp.]|tara:strand:+ start:3149 stop:3373 length:225 start_codon:yes stop_codon:yes gene_type:complete
MKKEFFIIVSIFLILTIVMHYQEFLNYPLAQIKALPSSGAYGFGAFHPIIFTLIVYLLLWIPRAIIKLFTKKFK